MMKKRVRREAKHDKRKSILAPQKFVQLRDTILPILEPYGIKRVALFGSVVHGEETLESDVDLLVKFKKPIGLLNLVGVEMELSKQLNRKVDLVTEAALSKYIRPYVEKEKVILYDR
jgi:predicted nucleotidyltransferase